MDAIRARLENAYYDAGSSSSYCGMERLLKSVPGVMHKDVREFLMGEPAYTQLKPVRRNFITNSTITRTPDHMWQADLSDVRQYSVYNAGVKYILFVIDVYTRYLWTLPLKNKKAESIAQALENLFSDTGRVPGYIVTDAGGEFRGGAVQKLLKEFNVGYFNLYSKNKAAIVERVQRTIKERMHRFFTRHNTYKYVDVLQDLTTSYNNSVHRSMYERLEKCSIHLVEPH